MMPHAEASHDDTARAVHGMLAAQAPKKKRARADPATREPKSKGKALPGLLASKLSQIKPFLPCFFDLPFRELQMMLGTTHHTLDPLRRELGLLRWPYGDVMRGKFCMTSDEIVTLRQNMMQVADAGMRDVMATAEQKAAECKSTWQPRKVYKKKPPMPVHQKPDALDKILTAGLILLQGSEHPTAHSDDSDIPPPPPVPNEDGLAPALLHAIQEDQFAMMPLWGSNSEESNAFWAEVSQILFRDTETDSAPFAP